MLRLWLWCVNRAWCSPRADSCVSSANPVCPLRFAAYSVRWDAEDLSDIRWQKGDELPIYVFIKPRAAWIWMKQHMLTLSLSLWAGNKTINNYSSRVFTSILTRKPGVGLYIIRNLFRFISNNVVHYCLLFDVAAWISRTTMSATSVCSSPNSSKSWKLIWLMTNSSSRGVSVWSLYAFPAYWSQLLTDTPFNGPHQMGGR